MILRYRVHLLYKRVWQLLTGISLICFNFKPIVSALNFCSLIGDKKSI